MSWATLWATFSQTNLVALIAFTQSTSLSLPQLKMRAAVPSQAPPLG
jgi:hypothetical protein